MRDSGVFFKGYFVVKNGDLFFVQKDIGEKPNRTDYSEIESYLIAKGFFETHLEKAENQRAQISFEKTSKILEAMKKISDEESKKIFSEKKIDNVIGWLPAYYQGFIL
jgi:hypothetical protein